MSGFRVMVVTEQPAVRTLLVRLVHERGFQAFPAADGIDALRQIYHVQPHAVVSDADLPNLSGFELLSFIRRRFPEIGVIALREAPQDNELALVVKADVILPLDPFNPDLFIDSLAGVIAQFPFRSEAGPQDQSEPSNGTRLTGQPNPAATCATCEDLQRKAGLARMNAVLARVWHHLNPDNEDAARQNEDADILLSTALNELDGHQREAHGRLQYENSPRTGTSDGDPQLAWRYATG